MLSTLLWLPVFGAAVIGFMPGNNNANRFRWGAIAITGFLTLWTIWLFTQFDISTPKLQMQEFLPWLPTLGINYSLGIDGLSLPLIGLSNLLTLLVAFSSENLTPKSQTLNRPRLFYALLLLINAGMAGALMAQNLLLFFFFYELELIPFYLLIVIWGGQKREYAGMKFLIYTATSGILILAAFLAIGWLTGSSNFEYASMNTSDLPQQARLILLTLVVIGFGIKIPLVPLHTWLPDAYVEASTPTAILLGGVLSKLGTYGLARFGVGLFPETWSLVSPGLSIIAAVCVMYGALAAIAQKDIKRMVAYSSIGHMGYVLLGMAALTPLSMVGSVSQMVSHGLILALLFYLVGVIEVKVGTRELDVLNGLLNAIRGLPMTSALLVLAGMASAGIPSMVGFVSEFLVFQGSFTAFPLPTLLGVVGSGLTAVYFVILLNRTCFGKLDTKTAYYPRVSFKEHLPAFALTALVFWLGIQPTWLVRWSETTTNSLVAAAPIERQVVISQAASNVAPNINSL